MPHFLLSAPNPTYPGCEIPRPYQTLEVKNGVRTGDPISMLASKSFWNFRFEFEFKFWNLSLEFEFGMSDLEFEKKGKGASRAVICFPQHSFRAVVAIMAFCNRKLRGRKRRGRETMQQHIEQGYNVCKIK